MNSEHFDDLSTSPYSHGLLQKIFAVWLSREPKENSNIFCLWCFCPWFLIFHFNFVSDSIVNPQYWTPFIENQELPYILIMTQLMSILIHCFLLLPYVCSDILTQIDIWEFTLRYLTVILWRGRGWYSIDNSVIIPTQELYMFPYKKWTK